MADLEPADLIGLIADVEKDFGTGPVRVRIIRCTCSPGAWPCECEREAYPLPKESE